MFNKKVSLVIMMLVFMLSLCAVSAADTNSTDDLTTGEADEEPPSVVVDEELLSAIIEEENLSAAVNEEPPSVVVDEVSAQNVLSASNSISQPKNYELRSKDVSMYYKGTTKYEVVLTQNSSPVKNVIVTVKINGETFKKTTNSHGKVSVTINSNFNLNVGKYTISASYKGITSKTTVKVLPVVSGKDLVKIYRGPGDYAATFLDNKGNPFKNRCVHFKLNGKTYGKKTNAKGVATININLAYGTYKIYAVHPYGYQISNKITVKHSIDARDFSKHYGSGKHFTATFYGTNGKVLANKYIKFTCRGMTFSEKTNGKGQATLKVVSDPKTFRVYSYNPSTGETVSNEIKILSPIEAKDMTVFTGSTSKFTVKLYKGESVAKNTRMTIYVDGAKHSVKTNNNGVATVSFKLSKGTYVVKSVDPFTGYTLDKKVYVKLASIKASNMGAVANKASTFQAHLLGQDGKAAKNTNMEITINGVTHLVKTDSKGIAKVSFKLKKGTYYAVSKDLKTGYKLTTKIVVKSSAVTYNKYGVSSDGKTILAIGRPSAPGEESKYGYTWYMAEFQRTCPYCHGHNLYWDVFWAGDEHTEVGIFPATGNREPGSTEGMIFCADCDSDFSIFGNEHVTSNPMHLKVVSSPTKATKEAAYQLKNGNYVKI